MSREVKRRIPLGILMGITAFFLIEYFAGPEFTAIHTAKTELTRWGSIISGFTSLFGAFLLLRTHVMRVARHKSWYDTYYSIIVLFAFALFFYLGTRTPERISDPGYQYVYRNMYRAASTAIVSLCFFWCIYGGYRTFTIRSWESAAIGLGAVIYTLRLLPIGPALIPGLAPLADWCLMTFNKGATRGGTIAVGLGGLVLALRTLIGKETSAIEALKEE